MLTDTIELSLQEMKGLELHIRHIQKDAQNDARIAPHTAIASIACAPPATLQHSEAIAAGKLDVSSNSEEG